MARRPDNTGGSLIYQEGKEIEGDYYVIAVYDDPQECMISFSAYELENDQTFTYPFHYSEFDDLFRFDSELMNPSNRDARFNWVIKRLDFIQDARGQKVLCVGQEATPDPADDDVLVEEKPQATSAVPTHTGGKITAATRAKLLKELDTQEDDKVHEVLVKSEGARERFLAELHAKRQLEQLKAAQRLQKADDEREARLAKLEAIKQQQAAKALQHKEKEEAKANTMTMLEALMKKKEAQAIRSIMQEKDEQDRGMGRAKSANRARRKAKERNAQEVLKIEQTRANQLGRKRDEQVAIRERRVAELNRVIAAEVFEHNHKLREEERRLREEKDAIVEEVWRQKAEERKRKDEEFQSFMATEEARELVLEENDTRRKLAEREYLLKLREAHTAEQEATTHRRELLHKEALLQWKVDLEKRAVTVRKDAKLEALREKKISEMEDARTRRFRETEFLSTMRSRARSPGRRIDEGETAVEGSLEQTQKPPSPGELEAFQRTFEQTQRQKRQAEREERRRQEEDKREKLEQLKGKDPSVAEVLRMQQWRKEQEAKKDRIEQAKLARELAQEKEKADRLSRDAQREETWERLEKLRREKSLEREYKRNEACIRRSRNLPMGTGLPTVLTY